jgi:citrate lyase subunit beta / citryl-CoA lyase
MKEFDEIVKLIEETEERKGLEKNSIKIIPSIETAEGLTNLEKICSSHKLRTIAICFGGDDYANDMEITRNTSTYEKNLEFARNLISIYARANHLPSIDTPNVNFKNLDSLIDESNQVKSIGFKGKFAIHPNQIQTLNEIFGISKNEYLKAKEIVTSFEKSKNENQRGSTSVDNRMVDIPVYKRALNVVTEYEKENLIC